MSRLLQSTYPWIISPLVVCSPMLRIAQPSLAVAVSSAGGIGFIAGGFDVAALRNNLDDTKSQLQALRPAIDSADGILPVGLGLTLFGCNLDDSAAVIEKYVPAAVWLFGAHENASYGDWARKIREVTNNRTKIWIQVGGVSEALEVVRAAEPDVIIAQGNDAGGHGMNKSASVIALMPEMRDAFTAAGINKTAILAAGGIVDGRGVAAALTLGADGVVMGTRFLVAEEALISKGYQEEIIQSTDGGIRTIRSRLFDRVKETNGWPQDYDGRAFVNRTYQDAQNGMSDEENIQLQKEEVGRGDNAGGQDARIIRYAGTGVGLIKTVKPAAEIVQEVIADACAVLTRTHDLMSKHVQA